MIDTKNPKVTILLFHCALLAFKHMFGHLYFYDIHKYTGSQKLKVLVGLTVFLHLDFVIRIHLYCPFYNGHGVSNTEVWEHPFIVTYVLSSDNEGKFNFCWVGMVLSFTPILKGLFNLASTIIVMLYCFLTYHPQPSGTKLAGPMLFIRARL